MTLRQIAFTDRLAETLSTMQTPGLLLSSVSAEGRPNVMTIGWGTPGIIWARPIFAVLVRPSRFTFSHIEATGEFVVNVPGEDMHETCLYCGTASGRDADKFAERHLTAVEAETVRAPLIGQCVRHYECKVVHWNDVLDATMSDQVRADAYSKGDLHRIYFGEILRATERA